MMRVHTLLQARICRYLCVRARSCVCVRTCTFMNVCTFVSARSFARA